MAIDRIGKGGKLPPASGPEGASDKGAPGGVEKKFHVDRAAATGPTDPAKRAGSTEAAAAAHAAHAAAASSPLARLRSGEIDMNGYLDAKVNEATAKIPGLSPEELVDLKRVLREQLATDPGLAELARSATGHLPQPPDE